MESITQVLQQVVETMCNDYCRYPREYDEDADGVPLCESEICAACPLNRLV